MNSLRQPFVMISNESKKMVGIFSANATTWVKQGTDFTLCFSVDQFHSALWGPFFEIFHGIFLFSLRSSLCTLKTQSVKQTGI